MRVGPLLAALGTALVLASAAGGAEAAPPIRASVVKLEDGSELVHVFLEAARSASLRWIVRSGETSDPPGKAGVARQVEHLVLQGSYATGETELFASARRAGAKLGAFTAPDYSAYTLDAPEEDFLALMESLITVVTNPALRIADLEREHAPTASEDAHRVLWADIERRIAPSGAEPSGEAIGRDDLTTFYSKHYIPSNVVVVVAGPMPRARVEEVLERATRLPPSGPEDLAPEPAGELRLPLSEGPTIASDVHLFGYALSEVDPRTCRALSSLLELRLLLALDVERGLAPSLETFCHRHRGQDFLFARAPLRSPDPAALDEVLRKTFRGAAKRGPTSKERAILKERFKNTLALWKRDPRLLADGLVPAVAAEPVSKDPEQVEALLAAPRLSGDDLVRAAKKSFVPKRVVELRRPPLGG